MNHSLLCFPIFAFACGCGGAANPTVDTANAVSIQQAPGAEEFGDDFDPNSLVQFDLLPSHSGISTTQSEFALIGRFRVQSGWHIYWLNPGESGLPTSIEFSNSGSLSYATPQFPGPIRFDSDGETVNYGYQGEVLVLVPVTVENPGKGLIDISGQGRWLACREDACVPGKRTSHVQISVGKSTPINVNTVAAARALLPRPGRELAQSALQLQLEMDGVAGAANITITASDETQLQLFPRSDQAVQIISRAIGPTSLSFRLQRTEVGEDELAVLAARTGTAVHYYSLDRSIIP